MANTQDEALAIWQAIKPEIVRLIRDNTNDCLRWKPAIVISADNANKKATVREIYGPIDGSSDYVNVPNITGRDLMVRDSVFIQYCYSATNSVIAYKNV